jgi:hypothetical protein
MKKKLRRLLDELGYRIITVPWLDDAYIITQGSDDIIIFPPTELAQSVFAFELGDDVGFQYSAETGKVIGRIEYSNKPPQYLVRYEAGDGCQREIWMDGDAIEHADNSPRSFIGDLIPDVLARQGGSPFTATVRRADPTAAAHADAAKADLSDD